MFPFPFPFLFLVAVCLCVTHKYSRFSFSYPHNLNRPGYSLRISFPLPFWGLRCVVCCPFGATSQPQRTNITAEAHTLNGCGVPYSIGVNICLCSVCIAVSPTLCTLSKYPHIALRFRASSTISHRFKKRWGVHTIGGQPPTLFLASLYPQGAGQYIKQLPPFCIHTRNLCRQPPSGGRLLVSYPRAKIRTIF